MMALFTLSKDKGPQFTSQVLKSFCSSLSVSLQVITHNLMARPREKPELGERASVRFSTKPCFLELVFAVG